MDNNNKKITYKDAGVDVERGYSAVQLMKGYAKETFNDDVLTGIGGFGGLYALGDDVLVSGTDGVGTKLMVAFNMDKHDSVGIDCVAMCVNDIVCNGAKPLFFLDYIASSRLEPEKMADIVKGVAEGCKQAGCALVGGETAEMPDMYAPEEYDIAGFATGIVKRSEMITGEQIKEGDVLIGLKSSGIHSNGFSLVRKVFDISPKALKQYDERLGCTVGEELLKPTKIYVKTVLATMDQFNLHGIAHITGGGFLEKLARILPKNLYAVIDTNSYALPEIFKMLVERTNLEQTEAYNTFNMGIGMVFAVAKDDADAVVDFINANTDDTATVIGHMAAGKDGVEIR